MSLRPCSDCLSLNCPLIIDLSNPLTDSGNISMTSSTVHGVRAKYGVKVKVNASHTRYPALPGADSGVQEASPQESSTRR